MSRLIDRLPTPERVLDKKLIVLSRSRVGTFSLYQALQILGYKPYHMYEVVINGITHMQLMEESLRCKYLGGGKPYGKAEFDKWFANFDVIVEIPQYFLEEFIQAYPDAKFMLTTRDVDAWGRSIDNALRDLFVSCTKFPLNAMQYIDPWVEIWVKLHDTLYKVLFHGKGIDFGMEAAKQETLRIQARAVELAPKDRFIVCKLEDGFGWEQICPFLDKEIPNEKYPRANAPALFKAVIAGFLAPRLQSAALKVLSAVLVPAVGVGAWWYLRTH